MIWFDYIMSIKILDNLILVLQNANLYVVHLGDDEIVIMTTHAAEKPFCNF